MCNSQDERKTLNGLKLCVTEICFLLFSPDNHLKSHDPFLGANDYKAPTGRLQGHLLVAPGCSSHYEREEEDGARDSPDDDVCTGDT